MCCFGYLLLTLLLFIEMNLCWGKSKKCDNINNIIARLNPRVEFKSWIQSNIPFWKQIICSIWRSKWYDISVEVCYLELLGFTQCEWNVT